MAVALRSRCKGRRAFSFGIVLCCAGTSPPNACGSARWVVRLWRDIHCWCKDPKLCASDRRRRVAWAARRQSRRRTDDADDAITARDEKAAMRAELSLRYRAFILQLSSHRRMPKRGEGKSASCARKPPGASPHSPKSAGYLGDPDLNSSTFAIRSKSEFLLCCFVPFCG